MVLSSRGARASVLCVQQLPAGSMAGKCHSPLAPGIISHRIQHSLGNPWTLLAALVCVSVLQG